MSQHSYRTTIPPIPNGEARPLWSVMIPTYNCATYLRQTLASVLAQDLGPELMQIEVVDDCSTQDDPAAVVAELGRERVAFYQQPRNVGHVKNFNTCLQRASGQLIHVLHGDDCVRDGFYWKMHDAFLKNPAIGAAFCRYIWMDQHSHWHFISRLLQPTSGILDNWLERIASEQPIQTPAIVVRRTVYERLGGFDHRMSFCGEDWEMWVRIAAHYSIWYEVEPLALHRTHPVSLAGRSTRTGQNVRDVRLAIEIYQSYLPRECATQIADRARERCGLWALKISHMALETYDWQTFFVQVREAWRTTFTTQIAKQTTGLIIRFVWRWALQSITNLYHALARDQSF